MGGALAIILALSAPMPTSAPTVSMRERVGSLRQLVETVNACALPGCTLKYDSFICTLWNSAQQGYVPWDSASFVAQGLRHGFNPGIDCDHQALQGHCWFNNYKSALMNAAAVSKAIASRLNCQKTIDLGEWCGLRAAELRELKERRVALRVAKKQ